MEVRLDSELLVKQLKREYRVRSAALLDLYRQAARLLGEFPSYRIVHIPREENRQADALANSVLNAAGC